METEREVMKYFIMAIAAALLIGGAVVKAINEIDSDMKYTIKTEHGTYHTNQFRICGRGIAFDTKGEKVIVLGNFNIISNLDK
jgi:hypothetical protein